MSTKSRSVFPFLHLGEHGLRGLPDESGDEGEDDGVGQGRGGEGGGEVEENPGDERVEEERRERKLDPHFVCLSSRKYLRTDAMVEGQELPRAVHASVIDADNTAEKDEKSESRDSSDSAGVHLS